MANSVDVVVVGAGPAGSASAVTLARAGRSTLLVDKARFPRDKCCGDGLTTMALRQLEELGLDPRHVPSWTVVDNVVLHSPSGRRVDMTLGRLDGLHAAVARRADLDAALVRLAEEAGAKVVQEAQLRSARPDHDGVTVEIEEVGCVRARHVIGADGMWSPLRRQLGLAVEGYRGDWHAFRQYFTDVSPEAARALHVFFEEDLLPGYAWSFPVGDRGANVGYGILRGGPTAVGDMGHRWSELLQRDRLRSLLGEHARPAAPHRAWPIPARFGRLPLQAGRALFVGDAAAATDPLTGEGIGQALLTGRLAAEAIIGPGAETEAGARYEASARAALRNDHRLAEALSRLLGRPLTARAAIRAAGMSGWTRRNFVRWMFEDYPRAALATPWRWHRGMFSPPGAYGSAA
jgi:geranylgeranyl reductase family protein